MSEVTAADVGSTVTAGPTSLEPSRYLRLNRTFSLPQLAQVLSPSRFLSQVNPDLSMHPYVPQIVLQAPARESRQPSGGPERELGTQVQERVEGELELVGFAATRSAARSDRRGSPAPVA